MNVPELKPGIHFAPVVSWFSHALENLPDRDVPASEFIESIRKGHDRRKVEEIRSRFNRALVRTMGDREAAKKAVAPQKKRLSCVTLSGVFSMRAKDKLQTHSGLLQADVDLLGDRKAEIREALEEDPHVWALFESATADGLKAVYRVTPCETPEQHEAAHATIAAHVKKLCGVDIDATGDVSRLCYSSYDPQLYFNPNAVELPIDLNCVPAVPKKETATQSRNGQRTANATERQRIAEEILGPIRWEDATTGFCECPGKARHTNSDGEKDCKVWLGTVPTLKCMHTSCAGIVDGVNHELRSRVAKAEWKPPAQPPQSNIPTPLNDPRPKVQLPGDNHLLSDCAREVGRILAAKDIFARGGLVFIINDHKDGFMSMSPEILRTWIEDYLVLYKVHKLTSTDQTIQFKRTVSQTDAAGILASPQFIGQLQEVERFNSIRVPVMRRDADIDLLPEGYDEETKSFTRNSVPVTAGMDIADARRIIDEILSEFLFADGGRSKAVAVAAMLTVFGRLLLPPKSLRPCFIFVANAEGAGKTLLVKCATVPVLGYAPTGTKPNDEDEMRKTLLAAVLEARPVIFFDNAKRHVTSEALEGFLSAQYYEGRILGQTKNFRGENNAVVFITGNACTVSPDLRRRSLFCELFLEAERAEDRVFQNNLEVPMLLERRDEILAALWALIVDWDKHRRPKPSRSNSSFPDWSNIIGGIVEHAGYGCPLETAQIEAAADQDGTDMRTLVRTIANGAKLKSVQFEEVVDMARDAGLFEWCIPPDGDLEPKAKSSFGKLLKSYDRRLINGYRFTVEGKGHARRFKVEIHQK